MTHPILKQILFSELRHLDAPANDGGIVIHIGWYLFCIAFAVTAAMIFAMGFFAGVHLARDFIGLNGWGS